MGFLRDASRLVELAASPTAGRPPTDPSDALHSRIFWKAWMLEEGGECAFKRRMAEGHSDEQLALRSDEIAAYEKGTRVISPSRIDRVVSQHPSLASVSKWPMRLLSNRDLTQGDLKALIAPYLGKPLGWPPVALRKESTRVRASEDQRSYLFPGDQSNTRPGARHIAYRHLEPLYERGDAYGFFAIVHAFRTHYLARSTDAQWVAAGMMVRSLPGLCRLSFVRPSAQSVVALVEQLLKLLPDACVPVIIDHQILHDQIHAVEWEPSRLVRKEIAKTGRVIEEPENAVVPLKIVLDDGPDRMIFPSLEPIYGEEGAGECQTYEELAHLIRPTGSP